MVACPTRNANWGNLESMNLNAITGCVECQRTRLDTSFRQTGTAFFE